MTVTELGTSTAVVLGSVITTYSLVRNKGFDALKQAAESWRSSSDAYKAEVESRKAENHELRDKLNAATLEIAALKVRIGVLEAQTDLSAVTRGLADLRVQDDERTNGAVAKILSHIQEQSDANRAYHTAALCALEKVSTLLDQLIHRGESIGAGLES